MHLKSHYFIVNIFKVHYSLRTYSNVFVILLNEFSIIFQLGSRGSAGRREDPSRLAGEGTGVQQDIRQGQEFCQEVR